MAWGGDSTTGSSAAASEGLGAAVAAAAPTQPSPTPSSNVPTYFFISPRYRTFTFTAGFICGQASLILVAVLFLRYVVFEDPTVALREAGKRKKKRLRTSTSKRQRRASSSTRKSLFSAAATLPPSDRLILEKLNYDLSTHPSESLDWLNVLLAQAFVTYRGMIVQRGNDESGRGAKGFVEDAMNGGRGEGEQKEGMVTLDYITVTEVDFGEEYPIFSNARVRPSTESGKVRIELDVDYSDHVSLSVDTKVCLNFPKPKFGIIPVSLALALVRFSATLTIEIPPPSFVRAASSANIPTSATSAEDFVNPQSRLSLSLHPDFILELASTSLIGSRAKLQDIPKVEQLIISRIRNWVVGNLVWPKVKNVRLPSLGKEKAAAATRDSNSTEEFVFVGPHASRDAKNPAMGADIATSPESTSAVDDESEEDEDEEDDLIDEDRLDELNPHARRRATHPRRFVRGASSTASSPIGASSNAHLRRTVKSPSPMSSSSNIPVEAFSTALEAEEAHEQHTQQHLSHRKYSRSSAPNPTTSASSSPRLDQGGLNYNAPAHSTGNNRTATAGPNISITTSPTTAATAIGRQMSPTPASDSGATSASEPVLITRHNSASGRHLHKDGLFTNKPPLHSPGLGLGFGASRSRASTSAASHSLNSSTSSLPGVPVFNSRNSSSQPPSATGSANLRSPLHRSTSSIGSNASTITGQYIYGGGILSPRDVSSTSSASAVGGASSSGAAPPAFPGFFDAAEPRWEAARRAAARERRVSPGL